MRGDAVFANYPNGSGSMRPSLSLVRLLTFVAVWLAAVLPSPIANAQTGSFREITGSQYDYDSPPRIVLGQDSTAEEAGPEHIRDNAFLVEEAFNQEQGEVQHIFNWIILWDRFAGGHARDFANTYTMEIPLGSQKHQFSFTTQFLTAFEKNNGSPASQQGDVGDTFLNYRY